VLLNTQIEKPGSRGGRFKEMCAGRPVEGVADLAARQYPRLYDEKTKLSSTSDQNPRNFIRYCEMIELRNTFSFHSECLLNQR
jgi:hypothetical protein